MIYSKHSLEYLNDNELVHMIDSGLDNFHRNELLLFIDSLVDRLHQSENKIIEFDFRAGDCQEKLSEIIRNANSKGDFKQVNSIDDLKDLYNAGSSFAKSTFAMMNNE